MSTRVSSHRRSAVDSFFKAIVELSDEEALAIARLLESPIAVDSLSGSIREHVKLRRLERRVASRGQHDQGPRVRPRRIAKSVQQSTIDLRSARPATSREFDSLTAEVFGNRDQFRSTIDVIESISQAFGLQFEYEKYKRSGRKKLLQDLRRRVQSMPYREREETLGKFMQWLENDSSSERDYSRLVKILTKNG